MAPRRDKRDTAFMTISNGRNSVSTTKTIIMLAVVLPQSLLHAKGLDSRENMMIWYHQPAKDWNAALPLGNGRLGAVVFGGVEQERLQINDDTFWTGSPTFTTCGRTSPC